MLVLTRKPGEKIHIGAGITITVIELAGSKVRLGIDAPKEVPVFREELSYLLDRIGADNAKSAALAHS